MMTNAPSSPPRDARAPSSPTSPRTPPNKKRPLAALESPQKTPSSDAGSAMSYTMLRSSPLMFDMSPDAMDWTRQVHQPRETRRSIDAVCASNMGGMLEAHRALAAMQHVPVAADGARRGDVAAHATVVHRPRIGSLEALIAELDDFHLAQAEYEPFFDAADAPQAFGQKFFEPVACTSQKTKRERESDTPDPEASDSKRGRHAW